MRNALRTIGRGIKGLSKAAVNADPAPADTVQLRRERCAACDYATGKKKTHIAGYEVLSPTSRCRLCKCLVSAKTKLRGESCPIGSW